MFTSFSRWKRDLSYTSQLPCVQTEEGKKDSQDQGLIVPSSPQTDISNTRSSDACKKRSLSHKDAEHERASRAPLSGETEPNHWGEGGKQERGIPGFWKRRILLGPLLRDPPTLAKTPSHQSFKGERANRRREFLKGPHQHPISREGLL